MLLFRWIVLVVGFQLMTISGWSQDAVAKADLKHRKILRDAFYIDQHGFWIVGMEAAALGGKQWNLSIQKFMPDLSKKEWEAEVKTKEMNHIVYNSKNPTYLYVRTLGSKFGYTVIDHAIIQLDGAGKVVTKDLERDETLDEDLFYFCDTNYYYEV